MGLFLFLSVIYKCVPQAKFFYFLFLSFFPFQFFCFSILFSSPLLIPSFPVCCDFSSLRPSLSGFPLPLGGKSKIILPCNISPMLSIYSIRYETYTFQEATEGSGMYTTALDTLGSDIQVISEYILSFFGSGTRSSWVRFNSSLWIRIQKRTWVAKIRHYHGEIHIKVNQNQKNFIFLKSRHQFFGR